MFVPFFRNKTIVILSPQSWNNMYLSKHNYARVLSGENKVIFISAPGHSGYPRSRFLYPENNNPNLCVLEYYFWIPSKLKFYAPGIYKWLVKHNLRRIWKKKLGKVDVCIDFGCYQQYRSIDWVPAKTKIFFPVDDHHFLEADYRGADFAFSVSKIICNKFISNGLSCSFINHGLSIEFEKNARLILNNEKPKGRKVKLKVGYSGSIFIPFLDVEVFRKIIENNRNIEFHFFGNTSFSESIEWQVEWNSFLRSSGNVFIHGILHPRELVQAYNDMDLFLLCYKPDYKNYHAENSHKVLEYLSTGKTLVTTYLSLYDGCTLMNMSPKDENEKLIEIFELTIAEVDRFNNNELHRQRIELALDNTYTRQLERIGEIINQKKTLN